MTCKLEVVRSAHNSESHQQIEQTGTVLLHSDGVEGNERLLSGNSIDCV